MDALWHCVPMTGRHEHATANFRLFLAPTRRAAFLPARLRLAATLQSTAASKAAPSSRSELIRRAFILP